MKLISSNLQGINRLTLYVAGLLMLLLIGGQAFWLYWDYDRKLEAERASELDRLEGIITAATLSINVFDYISMLGNNPSSADIQDENDSDRYFAIYQTLNRVKDETGVKEELYFINNDAPTASGLANYGVTSRFTPRWREEYPIPVEQLGIGTRLPHVVEGVEVMTVLSSIRDASGRRIAYLAVDFDDTELVLAANETLKEQIFFHALATASILLVIALFYYSSRRFLINEQQKASHNSRRLTDTFTIIEEFVEKVKRGDYSSKLRLDNYKDDNLARALDVLHKKLADNAQSTANRSWISEGRLTVASILRMHNNYEDLAVEVTREITNYVNAVQGAFYVINGEGKEAEIEMKARYAYNRRKYQMEKFRIGEGLVGQCAFEKATVYRTEIPEEYVSISSGLLGERRPSALLLVPLISNEKLHGILELASVRPFTDLEINFVEELSDIIARTLFNLKTNQRTVELLHETQEKSTVLQEQQSELQENARVMQETQEELKDTNSRLEEQMEEVSRTQRKLHSLLENSSEIITIYDKEHTVLYESPSVSNILGYAPEELVGQKDLNRVHEKGQEKVAEMFSQLMAKPDEQPIIEFSYQKKDGSWIWLEATGKNLITDPAINGIVFNSRDITERRKAEQEQAMRGKMQALSENSQDLIIRFDLEANFLYTNPMIEVYTGIPKANFEDKNLERAGMHPDIIEGYKSTLADISQTEELIDREIDFPTKDGVRVMRVNAIPEFDGDGKLETVLVVSHDITEQKEQENVIRQANKKITDSINYAKRIQNSIIPDNEIIQRYFPESFIFYLPKDVVSGDFPWFFKKDDDIYFAAVDCTGHGVPGAMMSLIGYFLLNEITGHRESYDPAQILTMLNDMVRKTLRQDQEGAQARDGMDVALTRINLKNNTVQYSGAHRPLYHVRNGELTAYKGARKAIGGTVAKKDSGFELHEIEIQPNDGIYFFSDGLPDQFGGPEGKKYSPRRIREMVTENNTGAMQDLRQVFEDDFQTWKGQRKQIDDVLLIGIKF